MEKSNVSSESCSTIEEDLFFCSDEFENGELPKKLKDKVLKQYEEADRKGLWFGN